MLNDQLSAFMLPLDFCCSILTNQTLFSNVYSLKIHISPNELSDENIGIGFQKIKAIVDNCLSNGIITNQDNELASGFSSLDNSIITLPDEPFDFFLGSILLAKFIKITERYFDIDCLSIASAAGQQVQYNVYDPYDCGLEIDGDFWWNRDDMSADFTKPVPWDELSLEEPQPFTPHVVKGGLSEN